MAVSSFVRGLDPFDEFLDGVAIGRIDTLFLMLGKNGDEIDVAG
jgi:hypothetical protein